MKRFLALILALLMLGSLLTGCSQEAASGDAGEQSDELIKESPMLAALVASGELPELSERLPVEADIMVETDKTPENPQYGGTLRRNNGGEWDYGPFCEEPLFRLTEDGGVTPNVAKGYDVSEDGLVYTIYLREGMKWSDGEPFTAEDCVYYYNYMLVSDVDNSTGTVTSSYNGNYYNWYKTVDPADGLNKPAIVTVVDDYTFQIKLYSPKPLLLQAIAIDNKWMFAPKHWYKDIVAFDSTKAHWSGIEDLSLIAGNDLVDVTEEQAVANAAAKNAMYTYENYSSLGNALGYMYWMWAGRPTLRAWNLTSAQTEQTLVFERNPYFWKTDAEGRQLPYIDTVEMVSMDTGLYAQEMMAKNLDMSSRLSLGDLVTYKAGEATGDYVVYESVQPNWTCCSIELNQTYKDAQYAELFSNIDFRHALSICVDRNELNEILYNGLAIPSQAAAPQGTPQYIEGATEKWTEYDPDAANALLDGIDSISKDRNADGYRTFTSGANAGQGLLITIEGHEKSNSAEAVALMAQYFKEIGIQLVESSNTARNKRNEKIYTGDGVMAIYEEALNVFNPAVRPDRLGSNRNISCWIGKYGQEHQDAWTPEPGTEIAKIVDYTKELQTATTIEEAQAAGDKLLQNHFENTWIVGYLSQQSEYTALSNRVKNFDPNFISCDELRFYGNAKPYTWFLAA